MNVIYRASLVGAITCFFISFFIYLLYGIEFTGLFIILFFLLLSIGFQGYEKLKRFSYSFIIFSAVAASLYFPQLFLEIRGYVLAGLIVPLIQIIMFGMGTSMSLNDFIEVVRRPKSVIIGAGAQFTIMPIVGFFLASISGFPSEIAAGIVLIGCSPSGMASNVMSYIAKANLALSITITSLATLLAPFATPVLMKILGGSFIEIDLLTMMWDIVKMVILPVGAGLIFNRIFRGKAKWLHSAMPYVSMAGIAVIIVIITAAGRDSLLNIGGLLIILVLAHNSLGYLFGYWIAKLFGLNEKDCRTISLEVGMQNGGLASGIAQQMGKIATLGLAAAVFGPLMNITGSILASHWHQNSIDSAESDMLE